MGNPPRTGNLTHPPTTTQTGVATPPHPPKRMYSSTVSRHSKQVSFDTEAYSSMSMGHGHSGMA